MDDESDSNDDDELDTDMIDDRDSPDEVSKRLKVVHPMAVVPNLVYSGPPGT